MNSPVKPLIKMGYSTLYEASGAIVWLSGMQIDADGSPNAYAPQNRGLDWTANAGHPAKYDDKGRIVEPANWWGVVTGNGKSWGEPILIGGKYVSTTALENRAFPSTDPRCYVDSEKVPFIVLPSGLHLGMKLGDLGFAYNPITGSIGYFICADIGPAHQIGEGSIALARYLNIPSDPRTGGVGHGIAFVVFLGSGSGYQDYDAWKPQAINHVEKWGGIPFLQDTIKSIVNQT
jgi:hypothetical protein